MNRREKCLIEAPKTFEIILSFFFFFLHQLLT
jgi:hypothetical protein